MAANSDEILCDFPPVFRAYKDGRVERSAGLEFVPPSLDPTTGVHSKDVVIAPEINLSARLYLPKNANPSKELPLLVFFHGGAFIIESAFSPLYHKHLNFLVAEANVVAVSVNYRLAPEHPLPTAYEDSWHSLKWVASQFTDPGQEEWIKNYADFNRVYLSGDSAGGNIAHNMAMRAGKEKLDGINLRGLILNCPFFWGKDPVGSEGTDEGFVEWKNRFDSLWTYACPNISHCDQAFINPAVDENLSNLGCRKILVYIAEKDPIRDRNWHYKEVLSKSGWDGDAEFVEVKDEGHVFSVSSPDGENGMAMLKKVASFINDDQ